MKEILIVFREIRDELRDLRKDFNLSQESDKKHFELMEKLELISSLLMPIRVG